jgi:phage gp46-like protein
MLAQLIFLSVLIVNEATCDDDIMVHLYEVFHDYLCRGTNHKQLHGWWADLLEESTLSHLHSLQSGAH